MKSQFSLGQSPADPLSLKPEPPRLFDAPAREIKEEHAKELLGLCERLTVCESG